MPRQLNHRQFYELCTYLRDNAKKIVDTRARVREIAADATCSLKFLVTETNAKTAIETVGIELSRPRKATRNRNKHASRTLARAIIKLARELNYDVGEEVYLIAGRGDRIAPETKKHENAAYADTLLSELEKTKCES